jgi:hypothetical protein
VFCLFQAFEEFSTKNLENRNGSHWQSQIAKARGLSLDGTPLQRQGRYRNHPDAHSRQAEIAVHSSSRLQA